MAPKAPGLVNALQSKSPILQSLDNCKIYNLCILAKVYLFVISLKLLINKLIIKKMLYFL